MPALPPMAALGASFATAWRAAPPGEAVERRYSFGGLPLVLRSTSRALADELDRPLLPEAHDRSPVSTRPTLRADIWDVSGGTPAARWTEPIQDEHRRVGPTTQTVSSSDGRALGFSGAGFALWLDVPARRVIGWVAAPGSLTAAHQYRPFAALIGPWLSGTGIEVLHASAVAAGRGAVVLPGPSGTGKSTCAMACTRAGMELLGDDLVGLDPSTGMAHTVYTIIKQREPPDAGEAVPFVNPDGEREWVSYVRTSAPEQLRASAPVVAVAFPILSRGTASHFGPIGAAPATRALLVADQSPGTGLGRRLARWGDVVEQMPMLRLHVGRDASGIPEAVRAMLVDGPPGA